MITIWSVIYLVISIGYSLIFFASVARLWFGKPLSGMARWLVPAYALIGAAGFGAEAARQWNWLPTIQAAFLARLPDYALFFLALLLLFLARIFLEAPRRQWTCLVGAVTWLAIVVVLDANFFNLPDLIIVNPTHGILRAGLVQVLLVTGFGGLMLLSGISLFLGLREEDLAYERNPLYFLAVAVILLSGGGGLLLAASNTGVLLAGSKAGLLLHLFGSSMVAYVFLSTRLPDFRRTVARILSLLMVTGLTFIFYVAGFVLIQGFFHAWPGDQPLLPGIVLAALLIALFNPAIKWIKQRLDGVVPSSDLNSARVLRQYSQSITNVLDLQLLATVAVGVASEAMDIHRGFLFLVDYEKGSEGRNRFRLRGVKGMGGATNPPVGILADNSPLADYLRRQHYPITLSELIDEPRFRDVPASEKDWLYKLGVEILSPIFAKEEWIGLLALGPRSTGEPFLSQNRDLLAMIADQTAVAMENVRLVEGLMRLNNEFRRAFTALDQANRHLERLDRTKSDFISIASHELRTPLTVISGSTQMLMEEPALQENLYYKQLLGKISNGSVRLREIVDSLLDVAKIDSRALELDPQPVAIKTLIESVGSELRATFIDRNQAFEIENLGSLPPIEGDQEALRKVFYHIIINAVKYTPDGGRVSVCGRVIAEGEDEKLTHGGVEVVVSDTGIGIDAPQKDLIFAKFYQTGELVLHSSGKTKFKGGGPGLGLAIARGVVDAHGGYVWVESPGYDEEKCPGSQFFVRMPLCQGPKDISSRPIISP